MIDDGELVWDVYEILSYEELKEIEAKAARAGMSTDYLILVALYKFIKHTYKRLHVVYPGKELN